MINFLKNILKRYYAKRLFNETKEINTLISQKKYSDSKKKFDKLINLLDKRLKGYRDLNTSLIEIHMFFIENNLTEVLKNINKSRTFIEENDTYSGNFKKYYLKFSYNLEIISCLFLDKIDDANFARMKFQEIKDLNLNEYELEILKKRFPLYDSEELKDFLIWNDLYKNYSPDKFNFVFKYLDNIKFK